MFAEHCKYLKALSDLSTKYYIIPGSVMSQSEERAHFSVYKNDEWDGIE